MRLQGPSLRPEARLLGLEETATFLGVTPRSVHRLVKRGLLTPVRLPGFRRTLFDREDLRALVALSKVGT
jgi:DNA-binding transcriptional MerR regulator